MHHRVPRPGSAPADAVGLVLGLGLVLSTVASVVATPAASQAARVVVGAADFPAADAGSPTMSTAA